LQPDYKVNLAQLKEARRAQEQLLAGDMFSLPRAQLFRINSEFHELLVSWSGNKYFLDTLAQINRLRRLIEYGLSLDRSRLAWQCNEHLTILAMLEAGDRASASHFLKSHIDRSWKAKERGVAYLASRLAAD
jgi:DNA-binding GntR family transcriptional regulator